MNIFTTLPKLLYLIKEFNRFNKHEKEIMAARNAGEWEEERRIIRQVSDSFCDAVNAKFRLDIEVIGGENIPDEGPVYVVSNHQSYADILMIDSALRKIEIGFIAKSEFKKTGPFAKTIFLNRSLFIDRDDPKKALATINEAADLMKKGYSFSIFPEGTRSHSSEMGEFKAGSFKPAQKAKVPILPISLEGGYHMFEEKNSFVPNVKCTVMVHPIVQYGEMSRAEQKQAAIDIEQTIRDGVAYLVSRESK